MKKIILLILYLTYVSSNFYLLDGRINNYNDPAKLYYFSQKTCSEEYSSMNKPLRIANNTNESLTLSLR